MKNFLGRITLLQKQDRRSNRGPASSIPASTYFLYMYACNIAGKYLEKQDVFLNVENYWRKKDTSCKLQGRSMRIHRYFLIKVRMN